MTGQIVTPDTIPIMLSERLNPSTFANRVEDMLSTYADDPAQCVAAIIAWRNHEIKLTEAARAHTSTPLRDAP